MKNRSVLNSPRLTELRRRKRKILKRKIFIFVILFLILFFGLSFVSKISTFKIKEIKVTNNIVIDSKDIEDILKKNISGNYLFLFSKSNFLIYPKKRIKNELLTNFKRLKDIDIYLEGANILNVSVSEYDGRYLWCGTSVLLTKDEKEQECYFLDSEGYIFDQAPVFSGAVYFKFYGDSNLDQNPSGSYFLIDKFTQIIEFKNILEKMNLKPVAFLFDKNEEEGNFFLKGESDLSPKVIFKMNENYSKLAENLQAAISTESLKNDLKNKFSSLIYIDLRFGNKVFYKFQ